MVFNWFRRQYSESKSSEKEATPEQPQDEPAKSAPVEPQTDAAAEESSPAVAEDYLNWAKAAYKNIQKQQKPETEVSETAGLEVTAASTEIATVAEVAAPTTVEATEADELEPAPTAPTIAEVPEVAAPFSALEATDAIELDAAKPAEIAETLQPTAGAIDIAPIAQQLEVTAENIEIAKPATEVVETESLASDGAAAEALPFWARAQADRMERIERLKETAIEEPEAIAAAAERAAIIEEIPGFAFDEGFLWSSEILASQGRRPDQVSVEEITWLQKLRKGLERTRRRDRASCG